jgi:hypothetical protein
MPRPHNSAIRQAGLFQRSGSLTSRRTSKGGNVRRFAGSRNCTNTGERNSASSSSTQAKSADPAAISLIAAKWLAVPPISPDVIRRSNRRSDRGASRSSSSAANRRPNRNRGAMPRLASAAAILSRRAVLVTRLSTMTGITGALGLIQRSRASRAAA